MLVPLVPGFQHYAWGDPTFIPALFGRQSDGRPWAEAWLGAHPAMPSVVRRAGRDESLDRVVAQEPGAILGESTRARFGELPFLLKVLAAARPLSIQVHPSKAQAKAGYARENAAGIPLTAPNRNYRDANHKPELIVALEPFDALCGFRPFDELRDVLITLPEVSALLPPFVPSEAGLREWVRGYFSLTDRALRPALGALVERLEEQDRRAPFDATRPEHWALRCHRELSGAAAPDPGLVFVFLLNLLRLAPGEGLYLPARVLHAYLRGAGIEIMASSDNVLRGGLTPKHVDRAELLGIVEFRGGAPPVIHAEGAPGERRYVTPAPEFELSLLELDAGPRELVAEGPEILLVLAAEAPLSAEAEGRAQELRRGEACLVTHGTRYRLAAHGQARVCRARVPAG